MLCFTKAFSIVFLGNNRKESKKDISELGFLQLFPMYLIALFLLIIGLFPSFFIGVLQQPVKLFTQNISLNIAHDHVNAFVSLQTINWFSAGFIIIVLIVAGLRKIVNRRKNITIAETWSCGYNSESPKLQYTANSFVRTYTKLFKPLLEIEKREIEITEIFPTIKHYETHPYDKIEHFFIDKPLKIIKIVTGWFLFLQNGRLQQYILYGIVFITAVICLPFVIEKITTFLHFLNNL
jgi:NADH:ubiquinone oxidoreductase subunit 5 (subunit L)/multisubunit Na+/H+ antiporter MnhA subunit